MEVVLEGSEVVAVPLRIGYPNQRLEPVARRRNLNKIDVSVSSQYRFGFLNVDVIEVQYNESAVVEQTLVTAVENSPKRTIGSFFFASLSPSRTESIVVFDWPSRIRPRAT